MNDKNQNQAQNQNKGPHGTAQVIQEQHQALSTLLKEVENQKAFLELMLHYKPDINYSEIRKQRIAEQKKHNEQKEKKTAKK